MKKFKRSKSNRIIAGVCGGLENWTGINAWVWRILMIIIGGGFWIYILLWAFTEDEEDWTILK
jgi:phage shock protein PspC (stress-responsive transcriptional regulator)